MRKVYPVILTYDSGMILIEVPDLDILTQSDNDELARAMEMARDAIGLKGISMEDHDEMIPDASEITSIDVTKGEFYEDGNSFVTLVDIDFVEYRKKNDNKMVRRNVTLPNWMNVAAEKEKLNVSKVLQEALAAKLQTVR